MLNIAIDWIVSIFFSKSLNLNALSSFKLLQGPKEPQMCKCDLHT